MQAKTSFAKAVATVGGWTVVSRVLGFVRDVVIARTLGAGPVADAFFIAFRLPNFFRQLFGEGAFNSAFVPLFTKELTEKGKAEAREFAEQAMSLLGSILLFVAILGEIFIVLVVTAMAIGFKDDIRFDLAVNFSRITFPYVFFICLAALYSGVLNAMGRFAAAAATPVLLNLTTIAAAFGLTPFLGSAGYALSWGILLAGIIQLAWLIHSAKQVDMRLRLRWPRFTPAMRQLLRRMVPGVLGSGIVQINLLIGTQLATLLPIGAVSYIYYADRLNQLPMAVIATAIGTALLPLMSRQISNGEPEAAITSQNRACEMALALTLAAAVGLLFLATPIVQVLYERGEFGAVETGATAATLMGFVVGLPAYGLIKVFTPAFFARGDTRTPVRVAIVSMVTNIALNLILMHYLAQVGIALATALAAWINVVVLVVILYRRRFFHFDSLSRRRIPLLVVGGLLEALVLWLLWHYAEVRFEASGLMLRIVYLAGMIGLGAGVYFAFVIGTGAFARDGIVRILRRRG
ncbi:MAG: murein biosynthesis integral membrane protein MurJ [Candidatus Pacebacteria bacterium]|nr:murein biosynthesis integral membrane protein MurJ [Candidatus Paceibacterota bacterium]